MESNINDNNYLKLSWENYINSIIEEFNFSLKFKERIKDLLKNIPKISISCYKELSRIEAENLWKQYKSENRDVFSNFFQRVYNDLESYDIEYVKNKYDDTFNLIANTLSKKYDEILTELINLNYYIHVKDINKVSEIKEKLKEYYRKFIIIYERNFTSNYVEEKIKKIKDYFVVIGKKNDKSISYDVFISYLKLHANAYYKILNKIYDEFSVDLKNVEFEELIECILDKNDSRAYEILKIIVPEQYNDFDSMRALKSLRINFSKELLRKISDNIKEDVQLYLNNPISNSYLKSKFTMEQLSLFNQVIPLMKESKSKIDFNSNELFISDYKEFSSKDKKESERFKKSLKKYKNIKKIIYDLYKEEIIISNKYDEVVNSNKLLNNVSFDDENYKLDNINYIFNDEILKKFLMNLNEEKLLKMDDYEFLKLKELLVNDSLLATILYFDFNDINLNVLINNFSLILKNTNYSSIKNNLSIMLKKIKIYEYASEHDIDVLGYDVVEKLVNNNQFLSDSSSPEDIKERIKKAIDLYERSQFINKSTIPYNCNVSYKNVNVSRYLNNDPEILTSGIDTNTCFKISSNDNDFLFYTILNKNGFVIKFTDENGKLIGRASGIRRNNILEINSVRNSENTNLISSKEQYDLYLNMLNALDIYAEKIISITSNSNTPIDFVVSNKAGILECSEFNDRYEILDQHLFENPINKYDDDWKEFVHTYDNCEKNFLQQADEESIFTTDFGSYPVVLIKARNGKKLQRLFDISYSDPEAIYERPITSPTKYSDDEDKANRKGNII